MTKYCVNVYQNENWESIALFSDKVSLDAMIEFAIVQFENGNSLLTPGANIAVIDLDTGEVLWNWLDAENEDFEPNWIDDDCGFDPYLGCFTDDC